MAEYTRRHHFTAALLVLSTIPIAGMLNGLFSKSSQWLVTVMAVDAASIATLYYAYLHKFGVMTSVGLGLVIVNTICFIVLTQLMGAIHCYKSACGWGKSVFAPDFLFYGAYEVSKRLWPWLTVQTAMLALGVAYWTYGRALKLK